MFPFRTRARVTTVRVETWIDAPPEACFDLARDVEFHARSLAQTQKRVIERPEDRALLEEGDTVTFEGRHFGIRFRHRARITALERPRHFRDEMIVGAFRTFVHDHDFGRGRRSHARGRRSHARGATCRDLWRHADDGYRAVPSSLWASRRARGSRGLGFLPLAASGVAGGGGQARSRAAPGLSLWRQRPCYWPLPTGSIPAAPEATGPRRATAPRGSPARCRRARQRRRGWSPGGLDRARTGRRAR